MIFLITIKKSQSFVVVDFSLFHEIKWTTNSSSPYNTVVQRESYKFGLLASEDWAFLLSSCWSAKLGSPHIHRDYFVFVVIIFFYFLFLPLVRSRVSEFWINNWILNAFKTGRTSHTEHTFYISGELDTSSLELEPDYLPQSQLTSIILLS